MRPYLLVGVGLGCMAALMTSAGAAKKPCEVARREARQAAAELSRAARRADVTAAAYYGCMKRNSNKAAACGAYKRATDQAAAAHCRARDAYRFARAQRKRACG